jgi:hypothetical protein
MNSKSSSLHLIQQHMLQNQSSDYDLRYNSAKNRLSYDNRSTMFTANAPITQSTIIDFNEAQN